VDSVLQLGILVGLEITTFIGGWRQEHLYERVLRGVGTLSWPSSRLAGSPRFQQGSPSEWAGAIEAHAACSICTNPSETILFSTHMYIRKYPATCRRGNLDGPRVHFF
jgi:hypothetical protein